MLTPDQDPQFLAFQRSMGYQNGELGQYTALRNNQLMSQFNLRAPVYADTLAQEKQGINDNFDGRGLSTSGVKAERLAQAGNRTQDRVLEDYGNTVMGQQMNDADLAKQIANNQRQVMDQSLTAASRVATRSAGTILGPYANGI